MRRKPTSSDLTWILAGLLGFLAASSAAQVTVILDASGDGAGNVLDGPVSLAIDDSDNVYVVGTGSDNAFRITSGGVVTEILDATGDGAGNTLDFPAGLAVDSAGNVYVAGENSHNVFRITPQGSITEIIDATGDGMGNTLFIPRGPAIDSSDNVYVASFFGGNVFQITPGGTITEILDSDMVVDVAVDTTDNVYALRPNTLSLTTVFKITPGGATTSFNVAGSLGEGVITTDDAGNVYVAGLDDNHVFRFSPDFTTSTLLIDGSGDGNGNQLDQPDGMVWDDASGDLYVTGTISDNVFRIQPDGSITELFGPGLDGPIGVALDSTGALYVTSSNSDQVFRIVSSDLSIAKTASADVVEPGDPVTYTLSVANDGPFEATSVVMTDTLPAGAGFVGVSATGWTCGEAGGVVTCTLASLAVGDAPDITIEVTAPEAGGTFTNLASVTAVEWEPTEDDNTVSAQIYAPTFVAPGTSAVIEVAKEGVCEQTMPDQEPDGGLGGNGREECVNSTPAPSCAVDVDGRTLAVDAGRGEFCLFFQLGTGGLGFDTSPLRGATAAGRLVSEFEIEAAASSPASPTLLVQISTEVTWDGLLMPISLLLPVWAQVTGTLQVRDLDTGLVVGSNTFLFERGTASSVSDLPFNCSGPTSCSLNIPEDALIQLTHGTGADLTVELKRGHPYTAEVEVKCDALALYTQDDEGNLAFIGTPGGCFFGGDENALLDDTVGTALDVLKDGFTVSAITVTVADDLIEAAGVDSDGDGVPDFLDICEGFDDSEDGDGDGVPDGCDVCDGFDDALDADGDGVPDGCDVCDGFDDALDADGDGVPDGCDICDGFDDALDGDGDGVPDGCDLCEGFDDALDEDGDGVPDGCDVCPGFDDNDPCPADLTLDKTDSQDPIAAGAELTYTLTVSNFGPADSTGGSVVDPLPAGLAFLSSDDGCSEIGGTVTCPFGSLAVGAVTELTFVATVDSGASGTIVNTATVAGNENDADATNNTASEDTTVDGLPPTVTMVDSLDTTGGGGRLSECEEARVAVSRLLVTFSEAVRDPVGDSDPDDVTNPDNYRLVAAGPDNDLETEVCGGPAGDDQLAEIGAVTYDLSTLTATLELADAPLGSGPYRLLVCGSTSILDLAGNALDGDGDGTGGDDHGLGFRVELENLLSNGHFDCTIDDWQADSTDPAEIAYSTEDVDGASISGSARVMNLTASTEFSLSQCSSLRAGARHTLAGAVRLAAAPGDLVFASRGCDFFDEDQCTGTELSSTRDFTDLADTAGSWIPLESPFVAPAGAVSARCRFELRTPAVVSFEAHLDDLALIAASDVFADGFETGDTSAWSSAVP